MTSTPTVAPRAISPLLILMSGIAGVGIQALMLSPLLTDIAHGLGSGAKEIGFASASYGAGVAVSALLAAPRLGSWRKRIALRIAFVVMAAGLLLCAASWNWRILAAGQLISGLAAGVIIPGTYAYTADISAPESRSQALGKVLFGWSVAMVAGVPVAALLSALVEWRGTFILVGTVAAAMALAMSFLPRSTKGTGQSIRYRDVLSLPGAITGYAATFSYMIGFYQTYTFIGDHVRLLHGTGAWLGGAISLSYGVGFGAGVIVDKWIDKTGPRKVLPRGLLLVGLNYAVLPFSTISILTTAAYPFLWGFANHLCMTALVSFLNSLSIEKRGTVMGLFSFVTYVSVGAGGAAYGPVYEAFGFYPVSLAAAAMLVAAAGLVLWALHEPPR